MNYHGSSKELPETQGAKEVDPGPYGPGNAQALRLHILQEIVWLTSLDSEDRTSAPFSQKETVEPRDEPSLTLKEVLALDAT